MSKTSSAGTFRGRLSKYYHKFNQAIWYSPLNKYGPILKEDGLIRQLINDFFSRQSILCIPRTIIERSQKTVLISITSTQTERVKTMLDSLNDHIKKHYHKPYRLVATPMSEAMNILYSILENCVKGLKQDPKKNPVNFMKKTISSFHKREPSLSGVLIKAHGRIRGASIKSSVKCSVGTVPLSTMSKYVFEINYAVQMPYGITGLRISIHYHPQINNYNKYNKFGNDYQNRRYKKTQKGSRNVKV